MAYLSAGLVAFVSYLVLTSFSGGIVLWSKGELIAGAVISFFVALATGKVLCPTSKSFRMLNPIRWLKLLLYLIGPFFLAMAKANFDVAYRVITGRIKPGIVKISPDLKTDLGITLLANSITLTPGTLSVDIDEEKNELYVHWINVKNTEPSPQEVWGGFRLLARRIAE